MNDNTDTLELFNNLRAEHSDDKDAIVLGLANTGIGVMAALKEYTKHAKATGLIKNPKERTAEVEAYLDDLDGDLADTEVRKSAMEHIADNWDVSNATAAQHIRVFAAKNDIMLPTIQRTSLEDMVAFVKECLDGGDERADVVAKLQDEMGYTANSAASAFSRASRELGLSTGSSGAKADISEVVGFLRSNKGMARKESVAKMAAELGYAESTANAFHTYIGMAEEWARQELEAAS